ncbi:MAG: glycosyltransferase [Deltaproteobacteria bacterium]|nr:glycosyltransferase [Deltaproteobacteria bacterium]
MPRDALSAQEPPPPLRGLTVVVAAYQEEEALPRLMAELYEDLAAVEDLEVIVVNDGSTDGTAAVMGRLAPPPGRAGALVCLHLPRNLGMGAALRAGYAAATRPWVTFLPGDGQIAPRELLRLCAAAEGGARLVTTRYTNRRYTPLRWLLSRGLRALSALIVGTRVASEGSYLIERGLLRALPLASSSFMLNLELPIRVARAGHPVALAWIGVRERLGGVSSAARPGRVWRTLRDLVALRALLEREALARHGARAALRLLWGPLRWLAVGGLLAWAWGSGLLAQGWAAASRLSPLTLAAALGWMWGGVTLGALRWLCLLRAFGLHAPPPLLAARLCYEGLFYNTLAPGAVGGDVLRAHWLRALDPARSSAHYAVTLGERVMGLVSLGLLCATGAGGGLTAGGAAAGGAAALCALAALASAPPLAARALPRAPRLLAAPLAQVAACRPSWVALALLVNTLGHLTSFALLVALAADLGVTLSAAEWLVSLSVGLLAANLPLSVAGVGPREASLVWALGRYGVPEGAALALSLSSLAVLLALAALGGLLHAAAPGGARGGLDGEAASG